MSLATSTTTPTKAEAQWITDVKRFGCLCCMALGYRWERDGPLVEAHHLLSGSIRRGHLFTIGLCAWHHRAAVVVSGWSLAVHRRLLGPSLAEGSVPFHARFGTDDELLAKQQRLVERMRRIAA